MKRRAALLPALLPVLLAARVVAATAYVSDELVLGVYAGQGGQGLRLATLHSGATVETLGINGEFTQVRLNDGATGWVKSAYLTTQVPATVRLKQLEEEMDRSRATTPALAEAAARSEVLQLKHALAAMQSELDAARAANTAPAPVAETAVAGPAPGIPTSGRAAAAGDAAHLAAPGPREGATALLSGHGWGWASALLVTVLACGYWLGYATLARRVKQKFGGIKVY